MRKSPCCLAPAAIHGTRRRICTKCGRTWTIRSKRRGRKRKRARPNLAETVVSFHSSLRGLAEKRRENREKLRRRFHTSLKVWMNQQLPLHLPEKEPLIAIVDALWFKLNKKKNGCFIILLRPVSSDFAYPGLLVLLPGKESKSNWEVAFSKLSPEIDNRIIALVGDGFSGLISIARKRHWYFQWCHFHAKRRMAELRGVRRLPGKFIRQRVTYLIYRFLEIPEEGEANQCLEEIKYLFSLSQCPSSVKHRLSGIVKKSEFFRTYREVPHFNLPVTTNSVEQLNSQIRKRFSLTRGVNSLCSLQNWLNLIWKTTKPILCRGYKQTVKLNKKYPLDHRKSVS